MAEEVEATTAVVSAEGAAPLVEEPDRPVGEAYEHVTAIVEGNDREVHWKALWQTYAYDCFRLAVRLVRNEHDAWSVVNSAWGKAHAHLTADIESFGGWIMTITRNQALDYLRGRRRLAARETSLEPRHHSSLLVSPTPESRAVAEDAVKAIANCERLTRDECRAFLLWSVGGFTYAEVVHVMDSTMGNVSSLIHRARKKLKELPSIKELLLPVAIALAWYLTSGGAL